MSTEIQTRPRKNSTSPSSFKELVEKVAKALFYATDKTRSTSWELVDKRNPDQTGVYRERARAVLRSVDLKVDES